MLPVWIYFSERVPRGESRGRALCCAQSYAEAFGLEPPCALDEEPGGKPVPRGGKLHISVSHSGELWACAVHTGAVGLDVQAERSRRSRDIARRFFCEAENRYLCAHPEDFYAVWCAKEAAVKRSGAGIARGFSKCCVADGDSLLPRTDGAQLHHFSPRDGYRACICAAKSAKHKILWLNW